MEQELEGKRGWIAVAAAFTAHFVGFGIIYSFTVFFESIGDEFAQGRGQTAWIVSIAAGLLLGAGGLSGRLSDHLGPRRVLALGATLIGSGLFLSSVSSSLWQVYLAYGIALGFGVSCVFVPSVATVGQWFERRRGLAIGIAVAGSGIGSLVLAPVSTALIDAYGWRSAMRWIGVGAVLVLFAAATAMRPRFATQRGGGAWEIARGNRIFRLMFISSLVASYGFWVPFVHIVPFAQDQGIDKTAAALLVSIMGIANTVGRVVMGAVADRIGRHRMMRMSALAMAGALFALPYAGSWGSLAIFGGFYGLFAGAFIALLPALAGDYFGMQRLAGITGLLFSGAGIGTLFGAPVTGMLFDARGSYTVGLVIAALAMSLGTVLLYRLPAPAGARAEPAAI